MNDSRLRVLIISHELSPVNGSECAIGWNIVNRLAKYHDITVLYASGSHVNYHSYQKEVNNYLLANGPVKGVDFINIDQPLITRMLIVFNKPFWKFNPVLGLPVLYYMAYKYWEKAAYSKAKEFHQKQKFDVVHHLTQITFREPGYTWKLGIPFFWGPTGGLKSFPKSFHSLVSRKTRIQELIRKISNFYQFNFSQRVIKANKMASVIYTYSHEDADILGNRATGKIKLMLDAGSINHNEVIEPVINDSKIIKGIWCGQLIERKAAIILLKAIAYSNLTREQIKFQIIGGGPQEATLHQEAKDLGLNNIEWIQRVDRNTVFKLMREADFLIHTGLREGTPHVIPESLSLGLPVICHDAYGMGIAVNETCGITVPLTSPEISFKGFNEAMERLVLNRKLLSELKAGAITRAQDLSWDIKAATMAKDYSAVINKSEVSE